MRVIRKRVGEMFEFADIENTLRTLQEEVGGYIEIYPINDYTLIVCNEEGRLRGLPYNVTISGVPFVGNILIVGADDDDFTDVPLDCVSVLS